MKNVEKGKKLWREGGGGEGGKPNDTNYNQMNHISHTFLINDNDSVRKPPQ